MRNHQIQSLMSYFVVAIVALTLALGGSVVYLLHKVTEHSDYEHTTTDQIVNSLAVAKFQTIQIQQYLTDSSATGENDGIEDATKARDAALVAVRQLVKLDASLNREATLLEANIKTLYDTGMSMVKGYRESQVAGNAIMKGAQGFDWQSENTVEVLDRLNQQVDAIQDAATAELNDSIKTTKNLTVILCAMICGLMISAGYIFYRIIMSQLGAEPIVSRELAEVLMEGDLSSRIDLKKGDTHSLLYCLSIMRARWTDIVTSLRGQAFLMARPANELNLRAHELAANAELQNNATARVLANIEELSVSIDQIAHDADAANQQLIRTGESAQNSVEELESVVKEIQAVATSVSQSAEQVSLLDARSKEIVGIVAVIKSIADQTNLLALNAAIEAARAGESGRGFAVVADEVRTLARRVAESTQTITGMVDDVHHATKQIVASIDTSVHQVKISVDKSTNARDFIEKISLESLAVSHQVSRINDALMEQRSNSQAISINMGDIAQATDKNYESSAGLAQSAEQLNQFAAAVASQSSYFKFPERKSEDDLMMF